MGMLGMGTGPGTTTPNYWRTIAVHNDAEMPVLLRVTFGDNETGHHVITEQHTLAAGESFTFPEQRYEEGGWQSVASVHQIDTQCTAGSQLGDLHTFLPHPSAGVEFAHFVHLSCDADGAVVLEM
eukprot:CAMPEP_0179877276 /NCGR_PEP_ID=MMETSP0982-20121206/24710_1 /TAXON_ID=483367 /ORGANISM="non described non described, Strain CCMP 2436" /LENGTH=124 /DNA_ID=CAMNT_0021769877 /DNA_START=25 /DNA_END=399 /DNA_ORIENTATION=+